MEKDLEQKMIMRKLFWKLGYSVRLDVVLRASSTAPDGVDNDGSISSLTDIDVLGVMVLPDGKIRKVIVDCKTGKTARSVGRVLWVKGLSDFTKADSALMIREVKVDNDFQRIAQKLEVGVISKEEAISLDANYTNDDNEYLETEQVKNIFETYHFEAFQNRQKNIENSLSRLVDYKQFDYWTYDSHKNIMQMVSHLKESNKILKPENPLHISILFDCAWLYVLSLSELIYRVSVNPFESMGDTIKDYILGGSDSVREKEKLEAVLKKVQSTGALKELQTLHVSSTPEYFNDLVEIVGRMQKNIIHINSMLRYYEFLSSASRVKVPLNIYEAFGEQRIDRIAAKLSKNVITFLVNSAGLNEGFKQSCESFLNLPDESKMADVDDSDERSNEATEGDN